ncbi:MAG: NAD-dependent epimerase/dehydratase family protein [Alphaproteobacteria bacterium]|nr:NAD-dependent epimerase/dehydratase family protein [Alphaproteobacteria bacterium]
MRILVTGGAGFIGSNFVHYQLQQRPDCKVAILDALTYAGSVDHLPPESLAPGDKSRVEFHYGNVLNADLVDSLVAKADVIVHFAAETHVTRSIFDNRQFFETDVLGTQVIANAVLRHRATVQKFVHISTSEVYGTAIGAKMDEDHALNPMSPYAGAKCGADRLVYSYWQTYQMPITIVRPFNNFGPRQHLEKVVPRFITSVMLGEPLTVHGDGSARRDFVYVEDVCRAVDLVLRAPADKTTGQVFNVGSEIDRSVGEIARDIVKVMGGDPKSIINIGERPGQVFRHTCDANKVRRVLGWSESKTWESGLKASIDWYKDNEATWRRQMWMRKVPIVTATGKREFH